ncbi:MAG: putative anti-sigma factor [Betaproteobacteria bacterium]|nr:putative anti-sigma factor [Betaproteobacteria bacterium]
MDIDCMQAREYLHAHLDRELDPVTAMHVETHLKSCAGCSRAYADQVALRNSLKQQAAYYTVPASLAARIRADMVEAKLPASDRRPRWQWFPLAAAVAATVVISWMAAVQLESSGDDRIGEQVIAGHARSVLTDHLVQVASSDQHTVKPWLSSKLDFSPPAADLTSQGFPLAGARLDYVNSRPVAALVYRHREHVINLFIWPTEKAAAQGTTAASKQGYNLLHWDNGGMTFWAISDLNPADIKTFADTYASAK